MQSRRHLNLVIALKAEATPLINHLEMKRFQPIGPLPLYQASGVDLVVSGPGRSSVESGVAYLHEIAPPGSNPVWVNIGICGHGSLDVGELLLADKVIEQNGDCWHLNTAFRTPLNSGPLSCVIAPQAEYEPQMAYDMESSGFIAALTSIASPDDLHIIKIVSDNPQCGHEKISGKGVRALITQQLDQISELIMRVTQYEQ